MKDKLFHSDKIEIRKSPLHGYGVFATKFIRSDELIEECRFIYVPSCAFNCDEDKKDIKTFLDIEEDDSIPSLKSYVFGINNSFHAFAGGFGPFYNDARTRSNPKRNIKCIRDLKNLIVIFKAIKSIKKDEELLWFYGENNYVK